MSEKIVYEVRFIETDDGLRIELKGDKERLHELAFERRMRRHQERRERHAWAHWERRFRRAWGFWGDVTEPAEKPESTASAV